MFDNYECAYGYEDEEWSNIDGFLDYYISNFGRVWSIRNEMFLKPRFNKWGYESVRLSKNGISFDLYVHRLVAEAFIPHRYDVDNANEVNHDDGDKLYNYVENLEWVTSGENQHHAYKIGLKTPAINAGRKRILVRIIETDEQFDSLSDCARAINGSHSKIGKCLRGERKSQKGYTFEYID